MTITDKQRAERIKGIGSSDAAAVLGVSPFSTPYEIWMEKTGRSKGFEGNQATRRGDYLEPVIRQMVSDEIGRPVLEPTQTFVRGILRANLDGMVDQCRAGSVVVECKSSVFGSGWGTPGTDDIPIHVMIQVQHQMLCAESDDCIVARLGPSMWPDIYPVRFDADLANLIETASIEFWHNHVLADVAPEITQTSDELISAMGRVRRTKGGTVRVNPDLCRQYVEASEEVKAAEAKKQLARAKIMAEIGDHADFEADGFKTSLTWVSGRTTVDSDKLKKEHPDIYESCLKTGSGHSRMNIKEIQE
jgi:putative phage-type endonuclease